MTNSYWRPVENGAGCSEGILSRWSDEISPADDYRERTKTQLVIMSYRVLVYVSISILLTLAASNCAQTETQVQSSATSPREIWKFETGG